MLYSKNYQQKTVSFYSILTFFPNNDNDKNLNPLMPSDH